MELYLLRHAIAEEQSASQPDSERRLTREGARKMRRIAKGMKALGLKFDLILTSPFIRAKQTGEIAASALKLEKRLAVELTLAGDRKPRELIAALKKHRNAERVLLVGHEPHLSQLISVLISGSERPAVAMKKASLCKLTVGELKYDRCAVLDWLLEPNQLAQLG